MTRRWLAGLLGIGWLCLCAVGGMVLYAGPQGWFNVLLGILLVIGAGTQAASNFYEAFRHD